ncbi:MAG TPA: hypothetical protein VJR02_02620 [Pyrinomonadaceae bacterium]|nr:hypothetical protein [Pyrinomonadaceae bacterium]
MKQSVLLTITSLLSLLFLSFHHADDVVRGLAPGKFSNLIVIVFMVFWLYATTLVFAERRSGYIMILVLCLLGSGIPVIHMTKAGMAGGRIANSSGAFFFVWTLVVIGTTTLFSVLLAARELWRLRRKD